MIAFSRSFVPSKIIDAHKSPSLIDCCRRGSFSLCQIDVKVVDTLRRILAMYVNRKRPSTISGGMGELREEEVLGFPQFPRPLQQDGQTDQMIESLKMMQEKSDNGQRLILWAKLQLE